MKQITHGGDIYSQRDIPGNKKIIDFSANVNPLGLPPAVKRAIIDNLDAFSNYPDPLCRELTGAISEHEKIPKEYIVCGNGAADIIYRIAAVSRPKIALLPAPTFSEYEQSLKAVGSSIKYHYLIKDEDFILDEKIFIDIEPYVDIMFLCNPNNPTGIPIKKEAVLKIGEQCKRNKTVLVVDECFIDFLENPQDFSIVSKLEDFPNIIVLKAFTKTYAMAGIRLGYGICADKKIISNMNDAGQPWNVSLVAQKCGVAALKEYEYVKRTRILIGENRDYLMKNLKLMGIKVFESMANYILFKSENRHLHRELEKEGILIRSCGNYVGLNDFYFRMAVKLKDDNEYFIKSMNRIL